MPEIRSIEALRTHSRPTHVLLALALLVGTAAALPTAEARAGLNPLTSRKIAGKHIWKHVSKLLKVRESCAKGIETGETAWSVDCSEDPAAVGGGGTGDTSVDADLQEIYDKAAGDKKYLRLRNKGTPEENGVDGLCSPASNTWSEIDTCARTIISDNSRDIFNLRFDPTVRTVTDERDCRAAIGRKLSGLYKRHLKARTACFKRNGLFGDGSFANLYDCRAPAQPPGLGRPATGKKSTDSKIEGLYSQLHSTVFGNCPDTLSDHGFPGDLSDPTGGVMGRIDLYQIMSQGLLGQLDLVLDGVFAGAAHCGDGNLDGDIGEECDDGNLTNCDTCDSNCTLPVCGNAVGCASSGEECDDGNAAANDGCTPACVLEYCGDGAIQTGIGEFCDDGNNSDGDGCSAICTLE